MAVIAGVINGENKNRDFDFSALASYMASPGVASNYSTELEVQENLVKAGLAFVKVTRDGVTPNEVFTVPVRVTADTAVDTSGDGFIVIKFDKTKVNDGSTNELDGTGIATIEKVATLPDDSFLELASLSGGAITDTRVYSQLSQEIKDQIVKADVDLGNVLNYGMASNAEAIAGTSNAKYMSPLRVLEAITANTSSGKKDFVAKGALAARSVCEFIDDGGAGKMKIVDPIVGDAPTVGAEQNFYAGTLMDNDYKNIAVTRLTDTKFVAVYNISAYPYFKCKVGTISGATISWGAEYTVSFPSVSTSNLDIVALTETKFMIANSYGGYVIGDVSGTNITLGTVSTFHTPATVNNYKVQLTKLRDDKVAILFIYSSSYAYLKVGTISGTTLTPGTQVSISSGRYRPSMCLLTTDKVAIMLSGSSTSNPQYLYVYDVSHDSNAPTQDAATNTTTYRMYGEICQLEDNKILLRMRQGNTDDTMYFQVATWNGSALTLHTEKSLYQLNSWQIEWANHIRALNKDIVAWVYRDENGDHGKLRMIKISGNDVSIGGETTFNAALTETPIIEKMSSLQMVLAFRDDSDTDKGHAQVVDFAITGVDTSNAVAVSKAAIADGATGEFAFFGGQLAGQSGLTEGQKMYVDNDGILTTTEENEQMGVCLSANDIFLEKVPLGGKVSTVATGGFYLSSLGQEYTLNHNLGRVPKKIRGHCHYSGNNSYYHGAGFWSETGQKYSRAYSGGYGDGFFSMHSGDVIEISKVTDTQITFKKTGHAVSWSYGFALELE